MAWQIGRLYLEAGRSARHGFAWGDGGYKGIQMVHAKPERHEVVIGGRAEVVVTAHSVVVDPGTNRYTYTVDVTARDGDWYLYRLRGQRVD